MARFELPEQPELASKVVDSHTKREERALEMGMIGGLFGNLHEKPGNIAGLSIAVSMVLLLVVFFVSYFWPNTNDVPVGQLITLFGGIITLALGYLFAMSSKE